MTPAIYVMAIITDVIKNLGFNICVLEDVNDFLCVEQLGKNNPRNVKLFKKISGH